MCTTLQNIDSVIALRQFHWLLDQADRVQKALETTTHHGELCARLGASEPELAVLVGLACQHVPSWSVETAHNKAVFDFHAQRGGRGLIAALETLQSVCYGCESASR